MPRSYIKWLKDNTCKTFLVRFCYLSLIPFLLSCSHDIVLQDESRFDSGTSFEIKYSMIFIIHGDGDYIYHDSSNNKFNADEEVLLKAKNIAAQNSNAEVFIFHQKPKRHFLFFIPIKDGEFYYYRNGKQIASELYWRDQEISNFDFEVAAFQRLHNKNKLIKMFLYFGHEVPEFDGTGYDESYPDRTFTIDNLTDGLKGFTSDSSKFNLTILATCFGGTPYTINKLGSYSNTIIASPENLHLSYFDLSLLEQLDIALQEQDVLTFAKTFARYSFDKLTNNVQTEVSIGVYNVEKVREYLIAVQNNYEAALTGLKKMTLDNLASLDHCDCADLPDYQLKTINDGVDILYRPARFGRNKNKQIHSGWECWRY